jgi:hypothetical protein
LREWHKRYAKEKPHVKAAALARYVAAKKQAIASWGDKEMIDAFYEQAARLTRETGIRFEVDHIYPLQSNWVCGLHVETNLKILPSRENQSKSNRPHRDLGDEQPRCCAWPSIVHFESWLARRSSEMRI